MMVFIGKAFLYLFLYLFLYFLFLLFLTNIVGISPFNLLEKEGAIGALILAGVYSWDTVFKKEEQKSQKN